MLNNFKWYRKLRGGKWYLMYCTHKDISINKPGFNYWFRNPKSFIGIMLEVEIYD